MMVIICFKIEGGKSDFGHDLTSDASCRCLGDARFVDQAIQWQHDRNSNAKLFPPRLKLMLRSSEAK